MTHLTFCSKEVSVSIKYLSDYFGFEESKEINCTTHDLKCFWGATIYDDTDKMNIDLKHNRTTFYINYTIPLEELNDTEVSMMMRKHNCFLDNESLNGSMIIDSDDYEVDFDITFEDGILEPYVIEISVDQHYMNII